MNRLTDHIPVWSRITWSPVPAGLLFCLYAGERRSFDNKSRMTHTRHTAAALSSLGILALHKMAVNGGLGGMHWFLHFVPRTAGIHHICGSNQIMFVAIWCSSYAAFSVW